MFDVTERGVSTGSQERVAAGGGEAAKKADDRLGGREKGEGTLPPDANRKSDEKGLSLSSLDQLETR